MVVTKKAMAVLGGAAAFVVAVGFGGVTVSSPSNTTTPPPGVSLVPAPDIAAHGVHRAHLTGCISHLDC